MADRPLLSIQEFSALSGLSAVTVRRRLRAGLLPFTQLGGRKHRILIPAAALLAMQPSAAERPPNPPERPAEPSPKTPPPGPKPRWMRGPKPQ